MGRADSFDGRLEVGPEATVAEKPGDNAQLHPARPHFQAKGRHWQLPKL